MPVVAGGSKPVTFADSLPDISKVSVSKGKVVGSEAGKFADIDSEATTVTCNNMNSSKQVSCQDNMYLGKALTYHYHKNRLVYLRVLQHLLDHQQKVSLSLIQV